MLPSTADGQKLRPRNPLKRSQNNWGKEIDPYRKMEKKLFMIYLLVAVSNRFLFLFYQTMAKDFYLDRLKTINTTNLSEKDLMDYRILLDMLESYIKGYDWRL